MFFWKSFLLLPRFLVKNAKNNVFEDKWVFSKMFYQIKLQTNTNWSCHPKKKTIKHLNFSNDGIFKQFSKIAFFQDF